MRMIILSKRTVTSILIVFSLGLLIGCGRDEGFCSLREIEIEAREFGRRMARADMETGRVKICVSWGDSSDEKLMKKYRGVYMGNGLKEVVTDRMHVIEYEFWKGYVECVTKEWKGKGAKLFRFINEHHKLPEDLDPALNFGLKPVSP